MSDISKFTVYEDKDRKFRALLKKTGFAISTVVLLVAGFFTFNVTDDNTRIYDLEETNTNRELVKNTMIGFFETAYKDAERMILADTISADVDVKVETPSQLKPVIPTEFTEIKKSKHKKLSRTDYISIYKEDAIYDMLETGVPASITLAQGLLESGDGNSTIAVESLNHFGIKCRQKCIGCTCRNYSDDDIYDMFRVYKTVREGYRDHSKLLSKNNKRVTGGYGWILKNYPVSTKPQKDVYRSHMQWSKKAGKLVTAKKYRKVIYKNGKAMKPGATYTMMYYEWWPVHLRNLGYATDIYYAKKLIDIIESHKLYLYDYEALERKANRKS